MQIIADLAQLAGSGSASFYEKIMLNKTCEVLFVGM